MLEETYEKDNKKWKRYNTNNSSSGSKYNDNNIWCASTGGKGQGTTTRAFGESSGELFAGGGGAGSTWASNTYAGAGGAGGGGAGGYGNTTKDCVGKDGVENTGGGGGGASTIYRRSSTYAGGYGGSGVILVRFV